MTFRKLSLFLAIIFCLPLQSKGYEKNIYIYRNDGKFSAFLSNEVDSLKYSKIDLDGIEHEQNVVQEIWTPDSLYRIPLSVIDSVSVFTPEIKYASNVKHLNPNYTPYIDKVDGLNLEFSQNLPYNLRINKGDILLYDKFDEVFEDGFVGRVISVTNNDGITVKCEAADLSDVYDQYIAVGEAQINPAINSGTTSRASGSIGGSIGVGFETDSFYKEGIIRGNVSASLRVKVTAFINKDNKYIALDIIRNNDYQVSTTLKGELKTSKETPHKEIPLSNPISFISLSADIYAGISASIEGSINLQLSGNWESQRSIVYDNGTFKISGLKRNNTPISFDGTIEANGTLEVDIPLELKVKFLGKVSEIIALGSVGPVLELEYSRSIPELLPQNGYNVLKDASITAALQFQSKLQAEFLLKKVHEIEITPKFRIWEQKFNLVPEFSNITLESDSKQIKAKTSASGLLFLPCKVGFSIFDEDENTIDTCYDEEYNGLLDTSDIHELSATFSKNLQSGIKYKVSPIVRFLGKDFIAEPDDEIYLDCSIITGSGAATTYSAEVTGSTEDELRPDTEVGFVYSATNKNPTIENSQHCVGQMTSDNIFKSGFSGLRAGTTYYYRAYAHYNDKYYYGDSQCITTKRNCDHSPEDNFGGDFKKGRKPYASTGMSYEVEQRKAQIELTFSCVNPETECGYYLEADDKRGSKILSKYYSLGTVTGVQTIELEDLIPGTTYRYWAVEKNSLGSSSGNQRSFKTNPSPDPIGTIIDVNDITMESAKVTCHFENLESDFTCGIILTDGKWNYTKTVKPDADGNATIKIDRLVAETDYNVNTYISTDPEEELIIEKKATKFSTEGPDITGMWGFTTKDVFGGGDYYDLEIRSNGRTNNFYGVNYCYWERNGRNITLKLNNVVGGYESPTYYLFRGEFNEDFTVATGRAYYIQDAYWLEIYEELFDAGPFTLRRK